jgi:hypothetical protein
MKFVSSLTTYTVNNRQINLVALPDSGFACPTLSVVSIHQFFTGGIEIGRIKKADIKVDYPSIYFNICRIEYS